MNKICHNAAHSKYTLAIICDTAFFGLCVPGMHRCEFYVLNMIYSRGLLQHVMISNQYSLSIVQQNDVLQDRHGCTIFPQALLLP